VSRLFQSSAAAAPAGLVAPDSATTSRTTTGKASTVSASASGINVPTARRSSAARADATAFVSHPGRRRRLQLTLGLIWLVDAVLQYQPYMFRREFVTQTLEPAAVGTPYLVEHPSLWADRFMLPHIAVYNALFATIQLVIALAIFYRPLLKVGLAVSIVWALGIWWLAEGIGGITLGASPEVGAPGAAVLYAVIAFLVWPRRQRIGAAGARTEVVGPSVAESGPLGRTIPRLVWVVLWFGLAALGLQAANRSPGALHDMVTGMSDGEPGWIQTMNRDLAVPLAGRGAAWSILVSVLCVLIGVGVFSRAARRPAIVLAVVLGLAIWLVEDFGGVLTGSATDVNSGPLLMLLAVTFWPARRAVPTAD
jgi:hypothetical protein